MNRAVPVVIEYGDPVLGFVSFKAQLYLLAGVFGGGQLRQGVEREISAFYRLAVHTKLTGERRTHDENFDDLVRIHGGNYACPCPALR